MTEPARKGRRKQKEPDQDFWELKLYVAGRSPKSITAIENLKKICEEKLKGKYRITIVDVVKKPEAAFREQIVVIPTLIRELPPPLRKIVGDLSKTEKVLVGLDMIARTAEKEPDAS